MLNDSNVPVVISNIVGLALTDPAPPGDNWIWGGANGMPDARVGDTSFQATAQAQLMSAEPSGSTEHSLLLLEAVNGGTAGQTPIQWVVKAYQHYNGLGVPQPDVFTVAQALPVFTVLDVGLKVTGDVVAGDKFIVDNSGVSPWGIGGSVDIDGDGIGYNTVGVDVRDFQSVSGADTNTSQDFNFATVTLFGWEIDKGEFVLGRFDVTFDRVRTSASVGWPSGDRFDVTPEPATLSLLAVGGLLALRRRR
jgi:hypothetical protein